MRMTRTWNDNIADVVRSVFYKSDELKSLLMIPNNEKNNIQAFVDKYFVNDPAGEELLKDESVRVLYYAEEGSETNNAHVLKKYLTFDIFVKNKYRYNASNDGLKARDKMIARLIQEQLTDKRYVCNMRFNYVDDYDLSTKVVGYRRHHVVFSYKTTF